LLSNQKTTAKTLSISVIVRQNEEENVINFIVLGQNYPNLEFLQVIMSGAQLT
jgi:hypothetical protein